MESCHGFSTSEFINLAIYSIDTVVNLNHKTIPKSFQKRRYWIINRHFPQTHKVLHLADTHFDHLYAPGSNANCQDIYFCCRETSGKNLNSLLVRAVLMKHFIIILSLEMMLNKSHEKLASDHIAYCFPVRLKIKFKKWGEKQMIIQVG